MSSSRPPVVRFAVKFRVELLFALLIVVLFREYLFGGGLLYGTDSIPGGLFFRGFLVEFVREYHELPRWNPFILGGLPFLDATHGDTFFPSSVLQFLFPVHRGMGHKLVLHVFLAGAFMVFYLRSLRMRTAAAAFGGLVYMLSPILVSYIFAGQDGKIYVTSLAPLVFGLLERAMARGGMVRFLGLGLAIGVTILSAQIQMAYHCMWVLGALFVLRLFRGSSVAEASAPSKGRACAGFALAIVVGLLVAAVQLLPAVSYVKHPAGFSVRSEKTDYEHASSWSLHPEEVASMIVPEFCDAPNGYWGRNPFKLNSDYAGILTLYLAVLAIARRRDATRLFLAGTAVFAVAYSLGGHTPLHPLFYRVVPQVKLFRAPPLVMFAAAFSLAALSAHAIQDLLERPGDRRALRTSMAWGVGAAALIALAGVFAEEVSGLWSRYAGGDWTEERMRALEASLPAFRRAALLVAGILGAGAVAVGQAGGGGSTRRLLPWVLGVLVFADLWRIDTDFIRVKDPAIWTEPQGVAKLLAEESRSEKFRVMPVVPGTMANELGYHGIESALGFHDNELAWYRELRSAPEAGNLLAQVGESFPFLRVLNTKFVLFAPEGAPKLWPVSDSLGRFRLVEDWEVLADQRAVPARLADPEFDPAVTVLLEEEPEFAGLPTAARGDTSGRVTRYEYRGNEIFVDVYAERNSLLVHSENWFPYWHAFEGDRELPLLRAYGTVRAIPITPGTHKIRLAFHSAPYEAGKWITLATLFLTGVAAAATVRRRGRSA
ncbi:MAG: hypothetical protein CME07_05100 [Gemmatimonadetes bacterium]|nr:hypothetical protein [Gemmatimonadota bacterium]